MTKRKTLVPINILGDKQYKLCDFFEEFSDFQSDDFKSSVGCENIDNNLIRLENKDFIYFKNKIAFCSHCGSTKSVENGTYNRKLYFLHIGEQKCVVQRYKCKKCGETFITDLKSIVAKNENISLPI